jgi:hypothetical protein
MLATMQMSMGAGPVPYEVPQRDPDCDRSQRARKASQHDEAHRREQRDPGRDRGHPEEQIAAALAAQATGDREEENARREQAEAKLGRPAHGLRLRPPSR